MTNKIGTPEQEAAHKAAISEICVFAIYELRRTLDPKFRPQEGGYGATVEEARENMIRSAGKQIDKASADYLKSL